MPRSSACSPVSRPSRCQRLMLLGWASRSAAIWARVSNPRSGSRWSWLGIWWWVVSLATRAPAQGGQWRALARGGAGVVPQGGQVLGERADLVALLLAGGGGGGGGLAVVVAGGGQGAQGGVPAGFQGVGDEPVGGVDGEVAVPGGAGGLFGALDVGAAELVCAFGLGGQLVADGEGDLDGRRGECGQDQVADGGVDDVAGQVLADGPGGADAIVLAHVFGVLGAVGGGVGGGHPPPAPGRTHHALPPPHPPRAPRRRPPP